jgi:hypothetical protein
MYASGALADTFGSSSHDGRGDRDGLSSLGHISESHNGHELEIELVGFDHQQFSQELQQIRETIFREAVQQGVPEPDAAEIAEEQTIEIAEEIVEIKKGTNRIERLANEAKEEIRPISADASREEMQTYLLLNRPILEGTEQEEQLVNSLNRLVLSPPEATPRAEAEAMIPRNKAEQAIKEATLLRYKIEDFVARYPSAAEWAGKIFVGSVYALQGIEYAVAGMTAGPLGIAAKFATQESTAWAIDTTVEESSSKAAQLITQSEILQQEFKNTIKFCTYAACAQVPLKPQKNWSLPLLKTQTD